MKVGISYIINMRVKLTFYYNRFYKPKKIPSYTNGIDGSSVYDCGSTDTPYVVKKYGSQTLYTPVIIIGTWKYCAYYRI